MMCYGNVTAASGGCPLHENPVNTGRAANVLERAAVGLSSLGYARLSSLGQARLSSPGHVRLLIRPCFLLALLLGPQVRGLPASSRSVSLHI